MARVQQTLSASSQQWVEGELNKTDWSALPPVERNTKYRGERTRLEALALERQTTAQGRKADAEAEEARRWLATWTPGGRYDH